MACCCCNDSGVIIGYGTCPLCDGLGSASWTHLDQVDERFESACRECSGEDDCPVPALKFSALAPEHQAGQKESVLEALGKKSPWHKKIRSLIPKHQIKLNCTVNDQQGLIASHLTLHNDFKLVKLGRDYGFPRGFCVIVEGSSRSLVGQGTFYPKFANDDRNAAFSCKDFGGVSKISCFIKYSGSTGIVSIVRDDANNVVGWTASSKNSCNHDVNPNNSLSYPAEITACFCRYATNRFLRWCQKRSISSIGLEVFISSDQSHGYGYAASGCIVTAITKCSNDGQPVYLSPEELYAACHEIGLPTDRPICVQGTANIQHFVESLSVFRDLLTLSTLRRVLFDRCGIELETLHDELIDSEILEGFVIRRWKDDVEVESVKFKIWLYQMVTQVLRPALASKGQLGFSGKVPGLKKANGELREAFPKHVRNEMQKWCILLNKPTEKLCQWVIYEAAEASLPEDHAQLLWCDGMEFPHEASIPEGCVARNPTRGYWISLGDYAVQKLKSLMEASGWDVTKAASASVAQSESVRRTRK